MFKQIKSYTIQSGTEIPKSKRGEKSLRNLLVIVLHIRASFILYIIYISLVYNFIELLSAFSLVLHWFNRHLTELSLVLDRQIHGTYAISHYIVDLRVHFEFIVPFGKETLKYIFVVAAN